MFHIICFYDYVPKSVRTYSCTAEVCRNLTTHLKSRTLQPYVLIIVLTLECMGLVYSKFA